MNPARARTAHKAGRFNARSMSRLIVGRIGRNSFWLDKWRMWKMTVVNRGITTVSLLAIAAQLTAIRGFDFGQILLFVVPVLFAMLFSNSTPVTRGVILARVFLSLIAFGLFISRLPWLFPDLGGVDPRLPRESDRVLTWYCATYLLFCTFLIPLHLFTHTLNQHRLGMRPQFSRPTCYLGLSTALLLGPGMIWVMIRFLHVWPIV